MYDIESEPVLWLSEFIQGLLQLVCVNIFTGFFTVFMMHTTLIPSPHKLPFLLSIVFLLAYLSSHIFDPKTHIIGSIIGSVSMTFTVPLQSAAWLQRYLSNPSLPVSNPEVILRVAVPAALPSKRHPPEHPLRQFFRGAMYLALSARLGFMFDHLIRVGGFRLTLLGMCYVWISATGALNLTSAALGALGFPSPSPFRNPVFSPSLAHFWAGRWNAPVSDALRTAIYEPLRKGRGWSPAWSAMMCFVISAIAHEVVLLYCGVRNSRGEWLAFFVLSGVLVLVEKKLHTVLKAEVLRRLFTILSFGFMFHWLFLPVTVRTGFAQAGVKALGSGGILVDHMYQYLAAQTTK